MKTRHPLLTKLSSLLSIGLVLAASSASAQTFFYADPGSGSNTAAGGLASDASLASIGLDVWSISLNTGNLLNDTGSATTRPAFGLNSPYAVNIASSALAGPAGTVLDSVTLFLFIENVNPDNGADFGFSLFDGINGTGNLIDTIPLAGPGDEGSFLELTFTPDQWNGGVSFMSTGGTNLTSLTFATELSTIDGGARLPGLSATFVPVPEPSSVTLLGSVGLLAMFRRRRA